MYLIYQCPSEYHNDHIHVFNHIICRVAINTILFEMNVMKQGLKLMTNVYIQDNVIIKRIIGRDNILAPYLFEYTKMTTYKILTFLKSILSIHPRIYEISGIWISGIYSEHKSTGQFILWVKYFCIRISLKFVPKGPIDNKSALVSPIRRQAFIWTNGGLDLLFVWLFLFFLF